MTLPSNIRVNILLFIGSLIILILVNAILLGQTNQKVKASNLLKIEIQKLKTDMDAIESYVLRGADIGIRAYALVPDESLLEPFDDSFGASDALFSSILSRLGDMEYATDTLLSVQQVVDGYLDFMSDMKQLVDSDNLEDFKLLLAEDRGLDVWIQYDTERNRLYQFLDKKVENVNIEISNAQNIMLITQVSSLVVSAFLFFMMYRRIREYTKSKNQYISRIEEINQELTDHREHLEEQVSKRTNELEKTIKELKELQLQLIKSEKMATVGTFVSGVAHEINNPINYISGGVMLLEKEFDSSSATLDKKLIKEALKTIQDGTKRTSSLLNSLRSLTSGTEAKVYSNVNDIIESVLILCRKQLPAGAEIVKDLQLKEKTLIDHSGIQLVIMGIMDNAMDAIKEVNGEKKIYVTTKAGQSNGLGVAEISIFNHGPLIKKELLQKIFDPFFTTKDPGAGTGLGLSIAQSIIQEHEGNIHVQNLENGVEFKVQIPLKEVS